jgi:hypothetical protein
MFALISPNESRGQYQRIAELADAPFDIAEPMHWIDAPAGATIEGHAYDPVAKAIVAYAPDPEPEAIPTEVTMRQARLALLAAGKLAGVDAAIASMPEPQKTAASIEWEYSNALQRNNPFVAQLGAALGLDAAGIDALFVEAAKI